MADEGLVRVLECKYFPQKRLVAIFATRLYSRKVHNSIQVKVHKVLCSTLSSVLIRLQQIINPFVWSAT